MKQFRVHFRCANCGQSFHVSYTDEQCKQIEQPLENGKVFRLDSTRVHQCNRDQLIRGIAYAISFCYAV